MARLRNCDGGPADRPTDAAGQPYPVLFPALPPKAQQAAALPTCPVRTLQDPAIRGYLIAYNRVQRWGLPAAAWDDPTLLDALDVIDTVRAAPWE